MKEQQMKTNIRSDKISYIWLGIGAVLMVFSNGIYSISLAAWLFPVFVMRFTRLQTPIKGFIISLLVCSAGLFISWKEIGMIPLPAIFSIAVGGGVTAAVLFQIDRLVSLKFDGVLSMLAFPMAWTARDFLQFLGTGDSWGSLAYTQYGNLPLMQVVSVTGLWGLIFLITWLAPVVNFSWQHEFQWLKIKRTVLTFACVLSLVLIFGGARLNFFAPESETVRIASVTTPGIRSQFRTLKKEGKLPVLQDTIQVMEDLTEKAAHANTKIVFWQEYGALMAKEEQSAFIERAQKIAKDKNIYLMPGMGVFNFKAKKNSENKAILIDPSGNVVWEYLKHHLVPGVEAPFFVEGKGSIPEVETAHGKMAAVICYDLDFPDYIRKAGQTGVDLLLVPSFDWKQITPLHTHMGVFRAIENGFSLIRATGMGLSMAVDYHGRSLAQVNYFTSDNPIMFSDIPAKGVTTIYNHIGNFFAWICLAGILILVILALFRVRKDNLNTA
ncbi:MAG: hypothetical protein GY729_19755 [Desulfobacteraceae bacterium]|nr:hypothetical protein [Desulfobacteraceae bacterium]